MMLAKNTKLNHQNTGYKGIKQINYQNTVKKKADEALLISEPPPPKKSFKPNVLKQRGSVPRS